MSFRRLLYRAILRLHPAPFRERFSAEMLWIFDEASAELGMARLVVDALRSVWTQRMSEDAIPQLAGGPFQALPESSFSVAKLMQATVLASMAVLGFFALLQQPVPLPQPPRTFAVRRAALDLCGDSKVEHHGRGSR